MLGNQMRHDLAHLAGIDSAIHVDAQSAMRVFINHGEHPKRPLLAIWCSPPCTLKLPPKCLCDSLKEVKKRWGHGKKTYSLSHSSKNSGAI